MNKSIAVALACLLAAVTAHADDMMKKDPMPMEPKMGRKDAAKKKPMKQEAMKKEAMEKEPMQDGVAMGAMPHDDMRKEMPAQPTATNR